MKYNFDQVHDRSLNESIKWEFLQAQFGSKDAIPLWVADMDFKAADEIIDALKARVEQGIYGYTALKEDYFQAFIDWVNKRHGLKVNHDHLIFSPGVVPSIIMSILALTEPGQEIVIQSPVYGPFRTSIEDHGRKLVENPMIQRDGYYTMDLDHLETVFQSGVKFMILCSPHNPVGRVWRPEELSSLSQLLVAYDVTVISDEIHSDLIMKGHKHQPLATMEGMWERTITLMAPTKTFNLAGIQSSVIIAGDKDKHQKIQMALEKMDLKINNCFGQVAFRAAYNQGETWLNELLVYVEDNMDYVLDYISEHLHEIKVVKPEGTYLLWLDLRALGMSQSMLKSFLVNKAQVALTDGEFFGSEGQGFMRLNVACPRSVLEKAMAQLSHAMQSLRL